MASTEENSQGGFGLLPHDRRQDVPGVAGLAGAAGREAAVQRLLQRSYDAGYNAPQTKFEGDIYRSVSSRNADSFLEHKFSADSGQRYNPIGERMLYTAPTLEDALGEAGAYKGGMANRTLTKSYFSASPQENGKGGVADIFAGMYDKGLCPSALAVPKGGSDGPLIYQVLGEHPYSMPEQAGKGAADAGACAIRAPSATGEAQIDIIPRNAQHATITPLSREHYDANAVPGPSEAVSANRNESAFAKIVQPLSEFAENVPPAGMTDMPAGYNWRTALSPKVVAEIDDMLRNGQRKRPPSVANRASSLRYGATGGGAMALGTDLYRHFGMDEDISGGEMAIDTATATAVGGGSALALDTLTPRLGGGLVGGVKAGGAIGSLLEGGHSAFRNAEAYRSGRETASQATANTLVDTGIGLGAGASGAALGAALGSVIPGAGTALGAGLGFLGNIAGSYLIHKLADNSGISDWTKHGLAGVLSGAEHPLGTVWNGISKATHPLAQGASSAYRGAMGAVNSVGRVIARKASNLFLDAGGSV